MSPEREGWLSLSLALGIPVGRLLDEITAEDYVDYQQYLRRHPSAGIRNEYMLAQVCAILAATMGGIKKPKIKDYLLFSGRRHQTGAQMRAWAEMMAARAVNIKANQD